VKESVPSPSPNFLSAKPERVLDSRSIAVEEAAVLSMTAHVCSSVSFSLPRYVEREWSVCPSTLVGTKLLPN
jgi:hypothetical protein